VSIYMGYAVASKNAEQMQLADARCIYSALGALTAPPIHMDAHPPPAATPRCNPARQLADGIERSRSAACALVATDS